MDGATVRMMVSQMKRLQQPVGSRQDSYMPQALHHMIQDKLKEKQQDGLNNVVSVEHAKRQQIIAVLLLAHASFGIQLFTVCHMQNRMHIKMMDKIRLRYCLAAFMEAFEERVHADKWQLGRTANRCEGGLLRSSSLLHGDQKRDDRG